MRLICFEDAGVEKLAPIIHARPAYAIRCASFRLIDWLTRWAHEDSGHQLSGVIREYLRVIQMADYELDSPPVDLKSDPAAKTGVLLINARLIPSVQTNQSLRSLAQRTAVTVIRDGDAVLAAWLPPGSVVPGDWSAQLAHTLAPAPKASSSEPSVPGDDDSLSAFHWPHEVVAAHMTSMNDSVAWRIEHGDYQQREDGVFVRPGVTIGQYGSIATGGGPILLDENVRVGPFCYLEGPLHAGHDTRVIEHSAIKDGVSLGHTVKIGGEVEASVIEPYTNKQHHGFLGHSYLGSWINLGAGTCNSDLKNTYGTINIEYGNEKIATGMQFLGCIMGDYSKSAINTGIFTGKVVGVCSMLYGFVTGNVPSYVNYARLFGQTSLLPPDVMVSTQARMFARRKVQQRPCDIELIQEMYRRTESERADEGFPASGLG